MAKCGSAIDFLRHKLCGSAVNIYRSTTSGIRLEVKIIHHHIDFIYCASFFRLLIITRCSSSDHVAFNFGITRYSNLEGGMKGNSAQMKEMLNGLTNRATGMRGGSSFGRSMH